MKRTERQSKRLLSIGDLVNRVKLKAIARVTDTIVRGCTIVLVRQAEQGKVNSVTFGL